MGVVIAIFIILALFGGGYPRYTWEARLSFGEAFFQCVGIMAVMFVILTAVSMCSMDGLGVVK